MTEEPEITLRVTLHCIVIVMVGFVIYRMARANGRHLKLAGKICLTWLIRMVKIFITHLIEHPRPWQMALCRIGLYGALICFVVPIIAIFSYVNTSDIADRYVLIIKLSSDQLIGPIFLILLSGSLLLMIFHRKQIPVFFPLLSILGACYTVVSCGSVDHDFSHELFDECSGYGELIFYPMIATAIAHGLLYLRDRYAWKSQNAPYESVLS